MQLLLRDTVLAELLSDKTLFKNFSAAEDNECRLVTEMAKLTAMWMNDQRAVSDTEPFVQALGGHYLKTERGYHGAPMRLHQCLLEALAAVLRRLESGIYCLLGQQASDT